MELCQNYIGVWASWQVLDCVHCFTKLKCIMRMLKIPPCICMAVDCAEMPNLDSGGRDTDIVMWDLPGEAGLYRLQGHTNEVTDMVQSTICCDITVLSGKAVTQ